MYLIQIDEVELFCQSLQIKYKSDRKFGFDLNEMSSLEQTDFVNFIRNEFLRLCCSGNSFDIIIKFIKAVFLLSEYKLIEEIIPFQIIEDLVELGSYSVLDQLLPFLDKKSEFWATVINIIIIHIIIYYFSEIIFKKRNWFNFTPFCKFAKEKDN